MPNDESKAVIEKSEPGTQQNIEVSSLSTTPQALPDAPIPTSPLKTKFPKVLLFGLVIIIIAIGLGGGFFIIQNQKQNTKFQETLMVKDTDLPSPTPDTKDERKTYQNNNAGIYFQYPPEITITDNTLNKKNTILSLIIEGKFQQTDSGSQTLDKYFSMFLDITESVDTRSPHIIVSENVCEGTSVAAGGESVTTQECINKNASKFSPYKIGNINGYKGNLIPWEKPVTIITFKNSDKLYELWFWEKEGYAQNPTEWEETKLILSTFTFIKPASISDNLINSFRCGLNIQFPQGWYAKETELIPGTNDPMFNFGCVTITPQKYLSMEEEINNFYLKISRTKKGATRKSIIINTLEDYLKYDSTIKVWEDSIDRNKTYGSIKGIKYKLSGYITWYKFIFEDNTYIYDTFWPTGFETTYGSEESINQVITTLKLTN